MPRFKVYWDNGASACGTFDDVFDTREAAQEFADTWAADMNRECEGKSPDEVEACGGEDCYTAEVIEATDIGTDGSTIVICPKCDRGDNDAE
jgi:hypothetical protein